MKATVSLNGVDLSGLGRDVLVLGIEERAPAFSRSTLDKGSRIGAWITGEKRSYLEVGVLFALRTRRDRVLRAETMERICAWAEGGGILRVWHRPGRRLRVVCEALPAAGRVREWTSEYEITFRAYAVPYWEDEQESSDSADAAEESLSIARRGTARTPLWFSAKNAGTAAADRLSIAAGGTRMDFAGLGLAVGETLSCDEDEGGLGRVRILAEDGSARDATAMREITSSDELLLEGPLVRIDMSADQTMQWTMTHRGRYT